MNNRYNNFFNFFSLHSPTQNLIVFRALYSESKTDKYKPSKLQSTLTLLTVDKSESQSEGVEERREASAREGW